MGIGVASSGERTGQVARKGGVGDGRIRSWGDKEHRRCHESACRRVRGELRRVVRLRDLLHSGGRARAPRGLHAARDPRGRPAQGRRQGAANRIHPSHHDLSTRVDELPRTERRNRASMRLDEMPVEAIVRLMNDEERRVQEAVTEALPRIASAVELLVEAWREGGRWIYVGSGTSGRIAALDAAECPPTFGAPPERVLALLAGGQNAATSSVESAEDDTSAAVRDLEALGLGSKDAVVGLAASGSTPYVVAAVGKASEAECATIGISNNRESELVAAARVGIELDTGPEILTGSTRLKAGTSGKLVLNMLSTAAFTRLGKVYENLMVDVQATNEKLEKRARCIVREAAGTTEDQADGLVRDAGGSVKAAVVMGKMGVPSDEAFRLLEATGGSVRRALGASEAAGKARETHVNLEIEEDNGR